MTIHLSIPLFLPLAAGLAGLFLPQIARWLVLGATVGVLGYAVVTVFDFEQGAGLQYVTDDEWISELGIHYALGIDGINLFLILLTAFLWVAAVVLAMGREWERPQHVFFHLAAAETMVLGAFMAQDLALFVVFFDLMLIPFFFLVGVWGHGERVKATTKMVIYTLVGSLLMLAAAIALGVLSAPEGGEVSFLLADLEAAGLSEGTQHWLFLLFALAFLVKAPLFPLHGWMPDAYRAAPIPALLVFSAVVSKVGVYGFLRIVLPVLPDASAHFQELLLAFAVVSILYGATLAFMQDETRLVVGYSSVSQLGFIVLGIFSMDAKGEQGAVVQMIAHGLVAAALFAIIGALALRADGTDRLSAMGGVAFRAPLLAALFLITALATLAIPGSPSFVGEILILFGAFDNAFVWGVVASLGVVLASVYGIRVFQKAMHNRVGAKVDSRDLSALELGVIAPVVAAIVALGVYPQVVLERVEGATEAKTFEARVLAQGGSLDQQGRLRLPVDNEDAVFDLFPTAEGAIFGHLEGSDTVITGPDEPPDGHDPREADPEELEGSGWTPYGPPPAEERAHGEEAP